MRDELFVSPNVIVGGDAHEEDGKHVSALGDNNNILKAAAIFMPNASLQQRSTNNISHLISEDYVTKGARTRVLT